MKQSGNGLVGLSLGALVWLAEGEARADVKFELGPRIGYGVALGKAGGNVDLSDEISGQLPLWVDVGVRISGHHYVGLYYSYGFGFFPSDLSKYCDTIENAGGSCNVHDMRLGVQYFYHVSPKENLDPWLGVGAGYEWLNSSVNLSSQGQSIDLTETDRGLEFVNLQLGLDFPVAENIAVGPFVMFTLAQYSHVKVSCTGNFCANFGNLNLSGEVTDKALHEWLMFGGRATFQL